MDKKDLIISREFNAPIEQVWNAWADPEKFMKWWGPQYFTSPICKIDFRTGGKYLWSMQTPDGFKMYSTGTYIEVTPMTKLVIEDNFSDENGKLVPASTYGLPEDFPTTTLMTITFEDLGNKTKMTVINADQPIGEASDQTVVGWNQSFDKMEKIFE